MLISQQVQIAFKVMEMADLNDEALFLLIKDNDKIAFAELYNRYWDRLYNVACNKLFDNFWAEEIVQELFIDIWNRRDAIDLKSKFNFYLSAALKYKIIRARVLKHKHDYNFKELNESYEIIEKVAALDEGDNSIEVLRKKIEAHLKSLPEKSQLLYKLHWEDGLSVKKISTLLDIPAKTIESQLYRALKNLKQSINRFSALYVYKIKIFNKILYFLQ